MAPRVIGILRRFLPEYLKTRPSLTPAQWRAIRAITQCRTPALGGHRYACAPCQKQTFAFHSCNHKACPQCGREASRQWVERELAKRIQAPYFMVTFTLPAELREIFFRTHAKIAYDTFFAAAAAALQDCLLKAKWLGAATSGFTAILHTWNQQLHFHPHLHVIVPAAGLDAKGNVLIGKNDTFLVPVPALQTAFRRHFRARLKARDWQVDPALWHTDWGIHIQPFGAGTAAIKYLGAYVCRTAIGDHRILHADTHSVTFLWKDRAQGNRGKTMTLPGAEFVRRYLRHVLPPKMHATRYYGFSHPAAKATRQRIAFHSGVPLVIGLTPPAQPREPLGVPRCPCCRQPMTQVASFKPHRWFVPWPEPRPPIRKAPT